MISETNNPSPVRTRGYSPIKRSRRSIHAGFVTQDVLRAVLAFLFSIAALVAVFNGATLVATGLWAAVWIVGGGSNA